MGSHDESLSSRIGPFWSTLRMFWTLDQVEDWKNSIFTYPSKSKATLSCGNLITLSRDAHNFWNQGRFALKPVEKSNDGKELKIQLFWQPIYEHPPMIDIMTEPVSTKGIHKHHLSPIAKLYWDDPSDPDRGILIFSGDSFTLTTDDPVLRPLPNWKLLKMQWHLARVVGMSAAGDWEDSTFDTETDVSPVEWSIHGEDLSDDNGLRIKRFCVKEAQCSEASFYSFEKNQEWIIDSERERVKAFPLPFHDPNTNALLSR